jgi:hypothetical protein
VALVIDEQGESEKRETVVVEREPGKTREQMHAQLTLNPMGRHALSAKAFCTGAFGDVVKFGEGLEVFAERAGRVRAGNLDDLTDMLTCQALTLDTMFTEYTRRAAINIGQHIEAVDRYTQLATKAQAQCRLTVETLAKVKRGGKQHIQITHVHEGGQAIVADTVNGTGVRRGADGRNIEQVHEQAGHAVVGALSGPDPARDPVPLSSLERQEAVPIARGQVDGGAQE